MEEEEDLSIPLHFIHPIAIGTDPRARRPSLSTSVRKTVKTWRWTTWFKFKRLWASFIVPRRKLSRSIHSLKHSRHLQYGLKNAIGIALLSLPAFLPREQGGDWFQRVHGQWALITYIFVLETNTGATIRTGGLRFLGTVCGAIYAYVVRA